MRKILVGLLLLLTIGQVSAQTTKDTSHLNIVSWNIQNFGRSKSASDTVMKYICDKVKGYDIVEYKKYQPPSLAHKQLLNLMNY